MRGHGMYVCMSVLSSEAAAEGGGHYVLKGTLDVTSTFLGRYILPPRLSGVVLLYYVS